jgi:hypothetical protein
LIHRKSLSQSQIHLSYDSVSTVFCTQYAKEDWPQRLGSGVHADAIMDRIVHRVMWIETGSTNKREHDAANTVS